MERIIGAVLVAALVVGGLKLAFWCFFFVFAGSDTVVQVSALLLGIGVVALAAHRLAGTRGVGRL